MTGKKPEPSWMKPEGAKKAVVVRSVDFAIENKAVLQSTYHDHNVLVPGEAVARDSLGVVIMYKWRPTKSAHFAWMNDTLLRALHVGRKPEWVE